MKELIDFVMQHAVTFSLGAAAVFSILVTALPDDLRNFDSKTYWPKVLKALSQTAPKHPTPPA